MAHLKGQHVNLYLNGLPGQDGFVPITASTNCSLDVTTNTANGSAKDDEGGGIWDNPDPTNVTWTMSNESFIVSINALYNLLNHIINGNGDIVAAFCHKNSYGNEFCKKGNGIIDSVTIDAADGDYAKLSMSISSNGTLETVQSTTMPTITVNTLPKIKGKALMIAMHVQTGATEYEWRTLACSKSHKLTISQNLSDTTDKDCNDKTVLRTVTGKSVTLSTENTIEIINTATGARGAGINDLMNAQLNMAKVKLQFGYYPNSIGRSIHELDPSEHRDGWGAPSTVLLEGDFLVTSLSTSGANKEDATFSAEFQNKGAVTVTASAAAARSASLLNEENTEEE